MKSKKLSSSLFRSLGAVTAVSLLVGMAVSSPTAARAESVDMASSSSAAPSSSSSTTVDSSQHSETKSSEKDFKYSFSISVDRSIFYTDDQTPKISIDPGNLPEDIANGSSSSYSIYYIDVDTQNTFYTGVGTKYDMKIPRFSRESSKTFKVVVAKAGAVGYTAVPVDQLTDVIAESNEATVERGPWELTVNSQPDHVSPGIYRDTPLGISWQTNQPISMSYLSIDGFDQYYAIYYRNLNTGEITQDAPVSYGSLSDSQIFSVAEDETARYQFYIAKRSDANLTSIDQLEDIQATSNVIVVPPRKWAVESGDATSSSPQSGSKSVSLPYNATRSITESRLQAFYVEDATTGKIIRSFSGTNVPNPLQFTADEGADSFIIHVARVGQTVQYASELQYLQASSNEVYPETVPTSGQNSFNSTRFQNGSNPSTADCQQQCYGDPINTLNGELFENSADIEVDGAIGLNFVRSYSSLRANENGPFGHGTTFSYNMSIEGNGSSLGSSNRLTVKQENGSTATFSADEVNGKKVFAALPGFMATLSIDSSGNYVFTRTQNQDRFIFSSSGILKRIQDRIGNEISLSYVDGRLSTVSNDSSILKITWTGDLISAVTDGSQTVSYGYSGGNLITVTDSKISALKHYSYYSDNRIKTITQTNGGVYETTYDTQGRAVSQKDPRGGTTSFSYSKDLSSFVTQITLPDGSKTVEVYDTDGLLIQRTFAKGTAEEKSYGFSYASDGTLKSESTPSGSTIKYLHDGKGNLTYVASPGGSIYRFEYNSQNLLTRTINPAGRISTNEYSATGVLLKSTDYDGKVTTYEHNSKGILTGIKDPNGQKSGLSSTYSYSGSDLLKSTTDTRGKITKFSYDSSRNPVKITDALGNETDFSYANGNPALIEQIRYENGSLEHFSYDGAGRVVEAVAKDGTRTQYGYDSMDNLVTVTTPYGATSYEYDSNQRLISVTNPKGAKVSYEYTALGLLKKQNLPNGKSTSKEYNTDGLLSADVDSAGNRTLYGYSSDGKLERVVDPANGTTRLGYDKLGNITQSVTPSGIWTNYSYTASNQLKSMDEKSLRKTTYSYDDSGNLTKTRYADGTSELRSYDSEDNLAEVTDREGKVTAYSYDALNRTSKETRADQSEVGYSYDSVGNLLSKDYGSGFIYENSYNLKDQLLESTTPEGLTTEYGYNPAGELTSRGPPQSKVSYQYNSYGEITSVGYPSGSAVDYSYDSLGNLQDVKSSGDVLASYSYDDRYNISGTSYGNGTVETTEFDALNRAKKFTVANGADELYSRSLEFNADSQISKAVSSFDGTVGQSKSYQYSDFGTISSSKDELKNETQSHGYDLLNNLKSLGSNSYSYDDSSSRVTQATIGGIAQSYSYDGRGNRTQLSTSSKTVGYSWSKSNELQSVELSPTRTVNYSYDAAGLLASRSVTDEAEESFSWDTVSGSVPVLLEDSKFSYIYGADSTPFLQIEKSTGKRSYLHGDERGSVVLATDETGSSLWHRDYDEYGSKFTQTPTPGAVGTVETRFGYAGEYLDPDTGLYNLRARWYDPSTASFLSPDPALLVTGEPYSYGSGDPLSYTDPLGLWSTKDTANMVAGAIDGFIGFPVASSISNAISPGSVDSCSALYKGAGTVAMVGSLFIPGLGAAKGIGLAAKFAAKGATKAFGKLAQRAAADEGGFIAFGAGRKLGPGEEIVYLHGKKKVIANTEGLPRFNSQDPQFGEAAKHNADTLQGRKYLVQKETPEQTNINRKQTRAYQTAPGKDRDEVAPASTTAARDSGSSVRLIDRSDNRKHGTALRWFYTRNNVNPGDWFIYE